MEMQYNDSYIGLIEDFDKEMTFEESFKWWFLPISFTKMEDGYYTRCITSDGRYNLRILNDWTVNKWTITRFWGKDFKSFLEEEQAYLYSEYSQNWIQIIPVEKIKKLYLSSLSNFLNILSKDIDVNIEQYSIRVAKIVENWSKDL